MPIRLCSSPRCPNPSTYRGYCSEHARQVNRTTHPNAAFYNAKRWQMTRKRFLFFEPLCRECGDIATDVDHIKPLAGGGAPYAFNNLQPLCRRCHGSKTRKEQQWRRTP